MHGEYEMTGDGAFLKTAIEGLRAHMGGASRVRRAGRRRHRPKKFVG